ncbi:element excision factor XisH family protein [Dapis sp. BLCC M172]
MAPTGVRYNIFFQRPLIQSVIDRSQINLLIYDIKKEEIIKWLM